MRAKTVDFDYEKRSCAKAVKVVGIPQIYLEAITNEFKYKEILSFYGEGERKRVCEREREREREEREKGEQCHHGA